MEMEIDPTTNELRAYLVRNSVEFSPGKLDTETTITTDMCRGLQNAMNDDIRTQMQRKMTTLIPREINHTVTQLLSHFKPQIG